MRDILLAVVVFVNMFVVIGRLFITMSQSGMYPYVKKSEWVFYWLIISTGMGIGQFACIKVILNIL